MLFSDTLSIVSILTCILSFLPSQVECYTLVKECDSVSSICFQEIQDPTTNITIGMILPPTNQNNSQTDVIQKIIVPLPYGFAGFGFTPSAEMRSGTEMSLPRIIVTVFMTFVIPKNPGPIGTMQTVFITQNSVLSSDATAYVPASEAGSDVKVFMSSVSSYNSGDYTEVIFRCQNCPSNLFEDGTTLTILHSNTKPVYPTPTAFNATLPVDLEDMNITQIRMENFDAFRSNDFDSIAQQLEL